MCANRAKMIFPAPESLGAVLVRDRRAYNLRQRWAMLCGNRSQYKRVRLYLLLQRLKVGIAWGNHHVVHLDPLPPHDTRHAVQVSRSRNRSSGPVGYVVLRTIRISTIRRGLESFRLLSRSDMRWMHRPARHPGHAELNSRLHIGCCLRARSSGRGASFS